jgi:hypothetical protein
METWPPDALARWDCRLATLERTMEKSVSIVEMWVSSSARSESGSLAMLETDQAKSVSTVG